VGAAYVAGPGEGASPRHRAWPLVELGIPHGVVKLEVLRDFGVELLRYQDVGRRRILMTTWAGRPRLPH
jgi:hypothetical protein